ncbi:MAG: serine--tRNA ligase, partial [Acidobacteria bacterium]|nr:serine--tRNA ligase [Acidobacteriota bacterium]
MHSREYLRTNSDDLRRRLADRGVDLADLDRLLALDQERRSILVEVEDLKRHRNEASKAIGAIKRQGGDAAEEMAAVGKLKSSIEALEARLVEVEAELTALDTGLPNLAHPSAPVGPDESANRVERVVGEPRRFDFEPKAHWDLGPELGILDFERGAKVTGARFTAYFGAGARLERALISFMLDLHTGQHGYTEALPPFIVNKDSLFATG